MKSNFGTSLSRGEMKNVLGGLVASLPGCASHDDCGGYVCVQVYWAASGISQGLCCSVASLHDKNNICGGGQNPS